MARLQLRLRVWTVRLVEYSPIRIQDLMAFVAVGTDPTDRLEVGNLMYPFHCAESFAFLDVVPVSADPTKTGIDPWCLTD